MANKLNLETKVQAVSMLAEGSSIRGIERATGAHRDTIMRLGVRMGQGCAQIMSEYLTDLDSLHIQIDEMWGFVGAKQKIAKAKRLGPDFGDCWTWIALDAETKLIPCFHVGKRRKYDAISFVDDLASRLRNKVQLSSDDLVSYVDAVDRAFGSEVDYGTVIKTFEDPAPEDQRKYSPPKVVKVEKRVIQGNPDESLISTSYIEKQNHTVRMHCRRLSRLTNAFSKKKENLEAALGLHFTCYNFVRPHITLNGATPAMAAGKTDRFWTVEDLVSEIEGR